ncbi:hypothetical protein PILCRDRAFT_719149 [Piloderma croceum F 1598]|uniref:Uncharacterized protein n=1 Tax=Piloderma croceum (strain F 1598) TaxID=765440 RepID=A0A0C3AIZ8_PILCF|nr:hypothetical protein PILCRDRAFT_719149 [Piloderma croceum F 1598]
MKDTYYTGQSREKKARNAQAAQLNMSKQNRKARRLRRTEASGSGAVADGEDEPERNREDMLDIVNVFWSQPPMSGTSRHRMSTEKGLRRGWRNECYITFVCLGATCVLLYS